MKFCSVFSVSSVAKEYYKSEVLKYLSALSGRTVVMLPLYFFASCLAAQLLALPKEQL